MGSVTVSNNTSLDFDASVQNDKDGDFDADVFDDPGKIKFKGETVDAGTDGEISYKENDEATYYALFISKPGHLTCHAGAIYDGEDFSTPLDTYYDDRYWTEGLSFSYDGDVITVTSGDQPSPLPTPSPSPPPGPSDWQWALIVGLPIGGAILILAVVAIVMYLRQKK